MSKFFDAANEADPALIDVVMERSPQAPAPFREGPIALSEAAAEPVAPAEPAPLPGSADAPPRAAGRPTKAIRVTARAPADAFSAVRTVTVCISATSPVLPFDGLDQVAAERYRLIRTRILQHPRRPRTICISSSGIGDGKTINAINIAGALALKEDLRVLLADCDFRRASVAEQLGIPRSPGMSDVLEGRIPCAEAVVRVDDAPNLHVIPAGEAAIAPAELLGSDRWAATCEALRQAFDYVIVDSPPIGLVADYDLIQSACDSLIVIVRQDHTHRGDLVKALESVSKDKLLGIVMNSLRGWFPERPYSDYRGAAEPPQEKAAEAPQ